MASPLLSTDPFYWSFPRSGESFLPPPHWSAVSGLSLGDHPDTLTPAAPSHSSLASQPGLLWSLRTTVLTENSVDTLPPMNTVGLPKGQGRRAQRVTGAWEQWDNGHSGVPHSCEIHKGMDRGAEAGAGPGVREALQSTRSRARLPQPSEGQPPLGTKSLLCLGGPCM